MSEEAPRLRPAVPADAAAVTALIHETIAASYAGVYPPRAVPFFQDIHSAETVAGRIESQVVLIAAQDGVPIATGSLVDGEIYAVFVRADCQGQGLGKAVMAALEAAAVERGVTACTLSISLPAKAFYLGLGYVIEAERRRDLGDGQEVVFWKGRKRLGPAGR